MVYRIYAIRLRSGRDSDHLVEQVRTVLAQNRPMGGGAVRQQDDLVPALGERNEQRQQNRADKQPVTDRHIDRHGARSGAKDEADGNRQHIQNHHVLQEHRVQRVQRDVADGNQEEPPAERQRAAERAPAPSATADPSASGTGIKPQAMGRRLFSG